MGKYMLVVGLNCSDASKEGEFNEWYNKTHLPDVLETAGFVRATRWEHTAPEEKDAKFLALYEIESDDIKATMKALDETLAVKREAGRMSDLGAMVIMGTYSQLYELNQ